MTYSPVSRYAGFPPTYGYQPYSAYGPQQFYPGVTYGPYNSPGPTPYERLNAQLYRHEEETNGMLKGAAAGAATGAAIGGLLGAGIFSIPGAAIGGLIGGIVGGIGGRLFGGHQATHHDATDDGVLNGSPLLAHGMGEQHA